MIKHLILIATLLFSSTLYATENQCVDNKSVETELIANMQGGKWKTYIHIEVMEHGGHAINMVMEKVTKNAPEEISYIYTTMYEEGPGTAPILTKVVYSSDLVSIVYVRKLISYNAKTQVSVWNDKCLDKTITKK